MWVAAPATDLLVPELQDMLATSAASALKQAEDNLAPAVVGLGSSSLVNVTVNRRAKISPYLEPDSIDPHLGVIRIDRPDGTPLVTLWNYAIHGPRSPRGSLGLVLMRLLCSGPRDASARACCCAPASASTVADTTAPFPPRAGTCWGPDNMMTSGDIMGGVNKVVEEVRPALVLAVLPSLLFFVSLDSALPPCCLTAA